jgi:hypothetical protein
MSRYPDFDGTQACHDAPPALLAAYADSLGADPTAAQARCARCRFLQPCRTWALEHDVRGVWGGLTGDQRNALLPTGTPAPMSVSDELDQLVRIWRANDGSVIR